jgi:hypothetical protein
MIRQLSVFSAFDEPTPVDVERLCLFLSHNDQFSTDEDPLR